AAGLIAEVDDNVVAVCTVKLGLALESGNLLVEELHEVRCVQVIGGLKAISRGPATRLDLGDLVLLDDRVQLGDAGLSLARVPGGLGRGRSGTHPDRPREEGYEDAEVV